MRNKIIDIDEELEDMANRKQNAEEEEDEENEEEEAEADA